MALPSGIVSEYLQYGRMTVSQDVGHRFVVRAPDGRDLLDGDPASDELLGEHLDLEHPDMAVEREQIPLKVGSGRQPSLPARCATRARTDLMPRRCPPRRASAGASTPVV